MKSKCLVSLACIDQSMHVDHPENRLTYGELIHSCFYSAKSFVLLVIDDEYQSLHQDRRIDESLWVCSGSKRAGFEGEIG